MSVTPDSGRNEGPSVAKYIGGVAEALIGFALMYDGPELFGDGHSGWADYILILGGLGLFVDGAARALNGTSAAGLAKDLLR